VASIFRSRNHATITLLEVLSSNPSLRTNSVTVQHCLLSSCSAILKMEAIFSAETSMTPIRLHDPLPQNMQLFTSQVDNGSNNLALCVCVLPVRPPISV
jgi:hypothetical protein